MEGYPINQLYQNVNGLRTIFGKTDVVTTRTSNPAYEDTGTPPELVQTFTGPINVLSIIETSAHILYCKFTEDKRDIATGYADGVVRIFDCSNGRCKHTLQDHEIKVYPSPVTCVATRPVSPAHPITHTLLTSNLSGIIKCWHWRHEKCLYTIRERRQVFGLSYHHTTPKFITYGAESVMNMYDEELQLQERSFYPSDRLLVGPAKVCAARFNPKSNHELISGGWDNKVRCWDDRQPYPARTIEGVHISGEGLDFDRTGTQVLTCAWQDHDAMQVWDYGSCKLIETIVPDNYLSKLHCGRFIPGTEFVVCGGNDNNIIRIVNMSLKRTECMVRNNPGCVTSFDFGKTRRKLDKGDKCQRNPSAQSSNLPTIAFVSGNRLLTFDI